MKHLLIFIIILFSCAGFAQDTSIDKGSGYLYFSDIPGITPNTSCCSELAFNTADQSFWHWNRDSSAWKRTVNITQQGGTPGGNPGTKPKLYLDTNSYKLYWWNGTGWDDLTTGGGGGGGGGGGAVSSVFGRTGAVVAQSGDYTASEVTNVPSGDVTDTDLQAAINRLEGLRFDTIVRLNDSTFRVIRANLTQFDFEHIGADNLGNHNATENLNLGSHYLSPDGGAQGIKLDGAGNLIIESSGFVGSELKITEASAYGDDAIILKAPNNLSGNINFNLPNSEGTVDQVLRTDGSGNLSWVNQTGGGGSTDLLDTILITQTGHSFDLSVAPWNGYGFIPVALMSGSYVLAQADSVATYATSIITGISGDVLTLQVGSFLELPASTTLSEGKYYLSETQAGHVTSTEPDTSQAIIFVEKGATRAKIQDMRIVDYTASVTKDVLEGTETDTTLNLTNNYAFRLNLNGGTGQNYSLSGGNNGERYTIWFNNNADTLTFTDSLKCLLTSTGIWEPFPDVTDKGAVINFIKNDGEFLVYESTVACEEGIVAEYQAVLDSAEAKIGSGELPGAVVKTAQNNLIKGMVNAGIYSELDMLYVFRADNSEKFAKFDFIRKDTIVENGTVNFAAKTGLTSDDSSGWLDTDFQVDGGTNFVQNSAAVIVYGTGWVDRWDWGLGGAGGSDNIGAIAHSSGNLWIRVMGTTENNSLTPSATNGLWVMNRKSSTEVDAWLNGVKEGAVNHNSSAPSNGTLQLMKHSTQTSYSNATWGLFALSGTLSDSQIETLDSLWDTYLSAVAP